MADFSYYQFDLLAFFLGQISNLTYFSSLETRLQQV